MDGFWLAKIFQSYFLKHVLHFYVRIIQSLLQHVHTFITVAHLSGKIISINNFPDSNYHLLISVCYYNVRLFQKMLNINPFCECAGINGYSVRREAEVLSQKSPETTQI